MTCMFHCCVAVCDTRYGAAFYLFCNLHAINCSVFISVAVSALLALSTTPNRPILITSFSRKNTLKKASIDVNVGRIFSTQNAAMLAVWSLQRSIHYIVVSVKGIRNEWRKTFTQNWRFSFSVNSFHHRSLGTLVFAVLLCSVVVIPLDEIY